MTGVNIENFHWIYAYGTAFSLLLALLVLPWLARLRGWRWIARRAGRGPGGRSGSGSGSSRPSRSKESNYYLDMLDQWRADGFAIPAGTVVAAPPDLLLLLGALEDVDPLGGRLVDYSSVDAGRGARRARLARPGPDRVHPEGGRGRRSARTQHLTAERAAAPAATRVENLAAAPIAAVDRFRVSAIVTPAGRRPPAALGDRVRLEKAGRTWDLWRVEPP